jgi:hypothetical protein
VGKKPMANVVITALGLTGSSTVQLTCLPPSRRLLIDWGIINWGGNGISPGVWDMTVRINSLYLNSRPNPNPVIAQKSYIGANDFNTAVVQSASLHPAVIRHYINLLNAGGVAGQDASRIRVRGTKINGYRIQIVVDEYNTAAATPAYGSFPYNIAGTPGN